MTRIFYHWNIGSVETCAFKLGESLEYLGHFLESPYLFVHASLVGDKSTQNIASTKDILQGQTSSSMNQLKDIDNTCGGFCVFSNLFVKEAGRFRLRFSLFMITSTEAVHMSSITSNVFTVYPLNTYPGALESTFLSRAFSSQGIRITTRKQPHMQIR
ncbi:velvet factor-domain-containing protein [Phycomyces nitens]|nr:velvet factor-domain-containing protein [Phycomyces nitens]